MCHGIVASMDTVCRQRRNGEYVCRIRTATPFNTETSISAEEVNYYGHYPYMIEDHYFSQGNLDTKLGEYRQTTVAASGLGRALRQSRSWLWMPNLARGCLCIILAEIGCRGCGGMVEAKSSLYWRRLKI